MKKLTALLLLLPALASAEPQPWMKTGDADNLGLRVFVASTCPVTTDEIESIVKDEMVRSRIEPGSIFASDPFLSVVIQCTPIESSGFSATSVHYEFITRGLAPNNGETEFMRIGLDPFLSFTLVAGADFLKSSIRADMAKITADWIRANMDMEDDD